MPEKVIHCWSGPRSLSTATLYSFNQREDTECFDEPLYAPYLRAHPEISRPYRKELLDLDRHLHDKEEEAGPSSVYHGAFNPESANGILKGFNDVIVADGADARLSLNSKYVYLKHIAKFYEGIDFSHMSSDRHKHIILLRDPMDIIRSWSKNSETTDNSCTLEDTGYLKLYQLYADCLQYTGKPPIVINSNILRAHPKEVLTELCSRMEIPFDECMLSWPKGPKKVDGLWASHWYQSVWDSTGFDVSKECSFGSTTEDTHMSVLPTATPENTLSENQKVIYRLCLPIYEVLNREAIGMHPLNAGSSAAPFYFPLSPNSDNNKTIVDHGLKVRIDNSADQRNCDVLLWVGDKLVPRHQAKVSVFDSAVQGGDAVWEGLRVYDGHIFHMKEHLDRLFDSARAMAFDEAYIPSRRFIETAIHKTLLANNMRDGVHMRLTLSRGCKSTSSMNPLFNLFGACLLIVPEYKPVGGAATYDNAAGIDLITATNRRNPPQCVDSKIHHCNLINNILPKVQANYSNAADALMLDMEGMVSETNATNVFLVKDGILKTPSADACLPGITRNTIIDTLAPLLGIQCIVGRFSLSEFQAADEVFTTGTMGELTPVRSIDGRKIGERMGAEATAERFAMTKKLQEAYRKLTVI
jgi:protein-lysine N-methyltransferase EEF2KMT